MDYRTIVVAADETEAGAARVEAALALGRRFGAHVSALAYGLQPMLPGYGFAEASAVLIAGQVEQARAEAAARLEAVRAILARTDQPADASAEAVLADALGDAFAARVRFADLVLLGQPYGDAGSAEAAALLDGALFGTETPVLVCPAGAAAPAGQRVVIAWNGTGEALKAVRGAMPFLSRAAAIEVLLIDPDAGDPAFGEEPGADIALFLARHGLRVEVLRLPGLGRPVGEVLRAHVADRGADLLVMGAYGHSRFREFVLGGASRDLLRDVPVPILMAH